MAAQYRLPAIYGGPLFAANGGLISYNADPGELRRGAATYVDRLLRGAKVSDLPVQYPTKFHLAINLKTAKALGLEVPSSILLRADEVIELRRREFIEGLGAAAWPIAARAQQGERVRRIAFLQSLAENDPEAQARVAVLREGLAQLGWTDRNIRIEQRFAAGDFDQTQHRRPNWWVRHRRRVWSWRQ